ncbi:flavodoxin family protein [uncultured Desulfosarcina sp.]|uniref:flavodoxin family protein n=1 Tax=uncultured Desulfosarcina sp. TaxID=218289 RepID=UPI0029C7A619|nr:flavodoxin family protein [uncultured Desulfosarcina sp.]
MNILTLLGSPRKNGNTAGVLKMVEKELSARHQVERLAISSMKVNGCLGCKACQKVADQPGCVQKDDAAAIFERMMAADAVIYSSPLYCWDFSSQMKALIDRHFCLVTGYGTANHRSLIADKPTALLVTCGGPVKGNADVIQTVFDRVCQYGRARAVNKTVIPFCTTPDALKEDARAAARKLAGDVNGALRQ